MYRVSTLGVITKLFYIALLLGLLRSFHEHKQIRKIRNVPDGSLFILPTLPVQTDKAIEKMKYQHGDKQEIEVNNVTPFDNVKFQQEQVQTNEAIEKSRDQQGDKQEIKVNNVTTFDNIKFQQEQVQTDDAIEKRKDRFGDFFSYQPCKSPVCHHVFVVKSKKITFCSAAKVASTTTKDYFFRISDDKIVIPPDAKYGVQEANFTRLGELDVDYQRDIVLSDRWNHVIFIRNVVERFISGFLDKVIHDCKVGLTKNVAISHYVQFGFSCEKHTKLEPFISFMEDLGVGKMEGHFLLR